MKKRRKIIKLSFISVIIIFLSFILFMVTSLAPVSKDEKFVRFTVLSGESKFDIIDNLKKEEVIKNSLALKAYILLDFSKPLQAGNYYMDTSKGAVYILEKIQNGETEDMKRETVTITFVDGERLTAYAKRIAEKFDFEYNEVIEVMNDKTYLKELIGKYNVLGDELLNDDLYYPLEGYLYPDTYEFYSDASIKDIIEKMISNLEIKISAEKNVIDESKHSIHELLTMASIAQLEANNKSDRVDVAQVIYNRLDAHMTLGMDVTTYYGSKAEMGTELTKSQLNDKNAYNTRAADFFGLPVGPICNPTFSSIMAVLYPSEGNYLYFFADIATGDVDFYDSYAAFYEDAYGD